MASANALASLADIVRPFSSPNCVRKFYFSFSVCVIFAWHILALSVQVQYNCWLCIHKQLYSSLGNVNVFLNPGDKTWMFSFCLIHCAFQPVCLLSRTLFNCQCYHPRHGGSVWFIQCAYFAPTHFSYNDCKSFSLSPSVCVWELILFGEKED